jgi:hypothetical protein
MRSHLDAAQNGGYSRLPSRRLITEHDGVRGAVSGWGAAVHRWGWLELTPKVGRVISAGSPLGAPRPGGVGAGQLQEARSEDVG